LTDFQSFCREKKARARSIFLWVKPCCSLSTIGENKRRDGSDHNGGGDGDGSGDGDGGGGGGGGNHRGSSSNFWIHNLHRGLIFDCALFNMKTFHRDKL
jgi:hypothetical protein